MTGLIVLGTLSWVALILGLLLGAYVDKRSAVSEAIKSAIALSVTIASVLIYFDRGDGEPLVATAAITYFLGIRWLMLFFKSPKGGPRTRFRPPA